MNSKCTVWTLIAGKDDASVSPLRPTTNQEGLSASTNILFIMHISLAAFYS